MLMYLHMPGWKFGICRSELTWDQRGMRLRHAGTVYHAVSCADSALTSNALDSEGVFTLLSKIYSNDRNK